MAQLLKPQNVKIVTKDGEIVISLQLDININKYRLTRLISFTLIRFKCF